MPQDLKSLSNNQVLLLDIWHELEKDNLPVLLHSIAKHALICKLDPHYQMSEKEAKSLMTLADVLLHLSATQG